MYKLYNVAQQVGQKSELLGTSANPETLKAQIPNSTWTRISTSRWVFLDSVNTYVIRYED